MPRASRPRDSFDRVYVTWGRVPPAAHSLTFERTDGTTATAPVGADGAYAMVVEDSARKMSFRTRYRFAGENRVLGSGPALRR